MNYDWLHKFRFIILSGFIGLLIPTGIKYVSQLIDNYNHQETTVIGHYEKDGILLENVSFDKRHPNPYNLDNVVFKSDRPITYAYEINNGEFKIIRNTKNRNHRLHPVSKALPRNTLSFDFFRFEIHDQPGTMKGSRELLPYTNTNLYLGTADTIMHSWSGAQIIENEQNVWLSNYWWEFLFYYTTASPAFIKQPYKVGNEWHYSKENRGFCGDKNYKVESQYRIESIESIATAHGNIPCFVIKSTSKSVHGDSHSVTYFNEEYGFVRMEYEMPDGLKINLFQI